MIFNDSGNYSGSTLVLGALFFTFQIYGDFSGYSDIAIGTSRLFGFNLMQNFAFPYFSRDIGEFWRRWHISLSTWFRDYLYIPLGGSRCSTLSKIRNTFVIFTVSGFWHGANWTFIVWGMLNALYFMPVFLSNKSRQNIEIVAQNSFFPSVRDFFSITITFSLTVIAWIFFRAETVWHAVNYLAEIFSLSLFTLPEVRGRKLMLLVIVFVIIEWIGRKEQYAIAKVGSLQSRLLRCVIYYIILGSIFLFCGQQQQFIYFQF